MRNQPLLLLAPILLAAFTGCSVKVDVADENTTTSKAPPSTMIEKSKTAVQVDLFTDNQSKPIPKLPVASEKSKTVQTAREPSPPLPTPEPPSRGAEGLKSSESDRVSVVVVKNVVNVYDFDVQRHHETHYHLHEARPRKKPVKVRIEVDQKPARDERCSRLLREHLERVAMWEAMFK